MNTNDNFRQHFLDNYSLAVYSSHGYTGEDCLAFSGSSKGGRKNQTTLSMKKFALIFPILALLACNSSKQETVELRPVNNDNVIVISGDAIEVIPGKEFTLHLQPIPGRLDDLVGKLTWYLPQNVTIQESIPGYIMQGETKSVRFVASNSLKSGSVSYIAIETELPSSSQKHISIWPLMVQ